MYQCHSKRRLLWLKFKNSDVLEKIKYFNIKEIKPKLNLEC